MASREQQLHKKEQEWKMQSREMGTMSMGMGTQSLSLSFEQDKDVKDYIHGDKLEALLKVVSMGIFAPCEDDDSLEGENSAGKVYYYISKLNCFFIQIQSIFISVIQ